MGLGGERGQRLPLVGQAQLHAGVDRLLVRGLGYDQQKLNLTVSNDGILGCGLLRGGQIWVDGVWSNIGANCQQWPTRWASDVSVAKPQVTIVLSGTWDAFDRRINGRFIPFGSAESDQLLIQDIRDSLNVLSAQGAQVPAGIQVGLGTRAAAVERLFTQGDIRQTGNPLDMVIEGDGFFQVQLPDGQVGYSRDGTF